MAYSIKSKKLKSGQSVYLKKTGEKFTVIRKTKEGYEIADENGMEFYGVKEKEFKHFKN